MSFLTSLLGKKDEPIRCPNALWRWFQTNEAAFYKVVKSNGNIEKDFFNKLAPKLDQLKDGIYFLTGMYNESTAELILTADGAIENIVFVEELVSAAPQMGGWRFTALKPALDIQDISIKMGGYEFNRNNLSFYANDHAGYPDEIDITIVYNNFAVADKTTITNGVYLFLDNYLGELDFATTIDSIQIQGKEGAQKELIPIDKLKDYLAWRQKEFIEKYEGVRHHTDNDTYAAFEATLKNGKPLVAIMNTDLLRWDSKASHPWLLNVEIRYDGTASHGMPDEATYKLLDEIENELTSRLKDHDGYLNTGRQTADSTRNIYFACKDFRTPSKVLHCLKQRYSGKLEFSYDIYKDKYWQSFERFQGT
jgi:hypothetical protein